MCFLFVVISIKYNRVEEENYLLTATNRKLTTTNREIQLLRRESDELKQKVVEGNTTIIGQVDALNLQLRAQARKEEELRIVLLRSGPNCRK
jgi:hypothetical protein